MWCWNSLCGAVLGSGAASPSYLSFHIPLSSAPLVHPIMTLQSIPGWPQLPRPHPLPASPCAAFAPSPTADAGCSEWNGHLLLVGGWKERAGCRRGWTVAIGDGNRCFLMEAALANSGLCGLRQNPNYFQLGDCSDSCSEQGLLSQLRNLHFQLHSDTCIASMRHSAFWGL